MWRRCVTGPDKALWGMNNKAVIRHRRRAGWHSILFCAIVVETANETKKKTIYNYIYALMNCLVPPVSMNIICVMTIAIILYFFPVAD